MKTIPEERFLTVPQFAERAGMHPQTVRKLIAEGGIRARQRTKNSPYKIPASELQKIGGWVDELYA